MNERGFSIVESLVSMILLTICLAGGLAYYFNATEIMTLATHKRIAMEMANKDMEEIKENGYGSLSTLPTGPIQVTYGNFTADIRRRVLDKEGSGPNINKQVDIDVSWLEAGKTEPRTITLVTHMAP